jgi:hypothetical protein
VCWTPGLSRSRTYISTVTKTTTAHLVKNGLSFFRRHTAFDGENDFVFYWNRRHRQLTSQHIRWQNMDINIENIERKSTVEECSTESGHYWTFTNKSDITSFTSPIQLSTVADVWFLAQLTIRQTETFVYRSTWTIIATFDDRSRRDEYNSEMVSCLNNLQTGQRNRRTVFQHTSEFVCYQYYLQLKKRFSGNCWIYINHSCGSQLTFYIYACFHCDKFGFIVRMCKSRQVSSNNSRFYGQIMRFVFEQFGTYWSR